VLSESVAGRRLAAWLEAFNAGDYQMLHDFIAGNFAAVALQENSASARAHRQTHTLFYETQGLVPARVEESSPHSISMLARSLVDEEWLEVTMAVEAEPPHRICRFGIGFQAPPDDQTTPTVRSDGEMVSELETFLSRLVVADRFSGVVAVAKGSEAVFQGSYGLASRSFEAANGIDTKFNLASMNKMFTAVAVAQLAQEGKIAFGDLVGEHLPDFPNADVARSVTVHHLLTHTSGMGAFWNERFEVSKFKLRSVDDFLALFVDEPLAFRPGERFQYSNNGYVVLGALIERVSGDSYYDYVRRHIYHPAGMDDTDAYELDRDVPNLAIGYTRQGEGGVPAPGPRRNNLFLHSIKGGPAGGGYSTAGDLLRFGQALLDHRLLDAGHTDTVLAGKVQMGPGRYGYGFMEDHVGDHRVVGHGGGFPGISTRLDLHLDRGYSVAVLSNYDPPAADRVAQRIRRLIPSAPAHRHASL